LPADLDEIGACLRRAIDPKPSARYVNAIEMADAFALVLEQVGAEKVDQSILDRIETTDIPYVQYPQHTMLKATARINVYLHRQSDDEQLVVKLWPGLKRATTVAIDLALARLAEGVGRLIVSPVDGLPSFIRVGLSSIGPFVVYRHAEGVTLDNIGPLDPEAGIELSQRLIHAPDEDRGSDRLTLVGIIAPGYFSSPSARICAPSLRLKMYAHTASTFVSHIGSG
jgi:hypothetical protein